MKTRRVTTVQLSPRGTRPRVYPVPSLPHQFGANDRLHLKIVHLTSVEMDEKEVVGRGRRKLVVSVSICCSRARSPPRVPSAEVQSRASLATSSHYSNLSLHWYGEHRQSAVWTYWTSIPRSAVGTGYNGTIGAPHRPHEGGTNDNDSKSRIGAHFHVQGAWGHKYIIIYRGVGPSVEFRYRIVTSLKTGFDARRSPPVSHTFSANDSFCPIPSLTPLPIGP